MKVGRRPCPALELPQGPWPKNHHVTDVVRALAFPAATSHRTSRPTLNPGRATRHTTPPPPPPLDQPTTPLYIHTTKNRAILPNSTFRLHLSLSRHRLSRNKQLTQWSTRFSSGAVSVNLSPLALAPAYPTVIITINAFTPPLNLLLTRCEFKQASACDYGSSASKCARSSIRNRYGYIPSMPHSAAASDTGSWVLNNDNSKC